LTAAPATTWVRWLARRTGVDLRAGEGSTCLLLFTAFFLIVTFQYATKSVRQSTFIDGLGATWLPLAYLSVAIFSLPLLWLYARLADRVERYRVMSYTLLGIAASMFLCWWLFAFSFAWIPFVFYVWISIVYVLTVSQFWSFANHVLDARQAKRLFPLVGAGGLLGGIAGGQVARIASQLFDTRATFLVAAGFLVATVLLLQVVRPAGHAAPTPPRSAAERMEQAKGGLDALRRSRHLMSIAAVMTLTVMVSQLVDLQFNWAAEAWTHATGHTALDQRTAFFGNFFSIMGISALLFQLTFTARIHRYLGVGFAMRLLPVTMFLGTAALLLTSFMFPAGLIASAYLLKIGENGLRYSLDQVTRELLFLPAPSVLRLKAKAYIDVFVQRGAKGLAGLILLLVPLGILTQLGTAWVSLVLIVTWLFVVAWAYREYVRAFRARLSQREPEATFTIDISDVTTLEILMQSLGSADKRQVLYAMDVLEEHNRGRLVPPLLLCHDDATVRRRALVVLAQVGRRDAAPLVERLLADDDPEVRVEAVRTLGALYESEAPELMRTRLRDPDPRVRGTAIACLADLGREDDRALADAALGDLLVADDAEMRIEGVKAIAGVREPRYDARLVQLLYDANPQVAREAIRSVRRRAKRDGFNPVYAPTLVALLDNRRLKHDAREALVALGPEVVPALSHFLSDTDESLWVRRALPKTLARIDTAETIVALCAALEHADDGFLRRKIIEALGSLDPARIPPQARGRIEAAVREEARRWHQAVGRLVAVGADGHARVEGARIVWEAQREPDLLVQLLAEGAEEHVRNLFALLALLYSPNHVWASYRGLVGQPGLRAHALEYLDNTLGGDLRRTVFSVIGDDPLQDKQRYAAKWFGLPAGTRVNALASLLDDGVQGTADAQARAVGALYTVYAARLAELYAQVERLARVAHDRLVRETAGWVVERLKIDTVG
jgi:AAA family ATP:ADP antiporter